MRQRVRFLRNGRVVELGDIRPGLLMLDYLRLAERTTGTKASCEDGGCGACTIVRGRLDGRHLVYEPVNACTMLVAQADGCEIVTIEDIAEDDGTLHPVQQALVEQHATQCGFCTPGMAMSLFAMFHSTANAVDDSSSRAAIQGNLCRCTGYRSIISAGMRATSNRRETRHDRARQQTAALLSDLNDTEDLIVGGSDELVAAPANLDSAAILCQDNPEAVLIGGGTSRSALLDHAPAAARKMILLSRIAELRRIVDDETQLVLGAAVTLSAAAPALEAVAPDLGGLIRRIGGPQHRTLATVGGNLMRGGQAADLAAALMALGAELVLRNGDETRRIGIEALYASDGKVERELGEVLVEIHITRPKPAAVFRAYKVSRRWDLGASVITGAFFINLDEQGRIGSARFGYCGVAQAPGRAPAAEAALTGSNPLDRSIWPGAFAALRGDFAAMADDGGNARYRTETAQALLGKALIEAGGASDRRTRLWPFRDGELNAAG